MILDKYSEEEQKEILKIYRKAAQMILDQDKENQKVAK